MEVKVAAKVSLKELFIVYNVAPSNEMCRPKCKYTCCETVL